MAYDKIIRHKTIGKNKLLAVVKEAEPGKYLVYVQKPNGKWTTVSGYGYTQDSRGEWVWRRGYGYVSRAKALSIYNKLGKKAKK